MQNKKPMTIWIASIFITFCAIGLIVFAITMITANFGSHTSPNTADLNSSTKGSILGLAIIIIAAAFIMIYGVYRLFINGQRNLLLGLLGAPLIFGCIGETIDAFGTASLGSDAIGFGILVMFAIPITLLLLPTTRNWTNSFK